MNRKNQLQQEIARLSHELLELEIDEYINISGISPSEKGKMLSTISECRDFYARQQELRPNHFGYPANLKELSPAVKELMKLDATAYLANNCGDNNERGNYAMDSKDIENRIVKLFAERYHIEDGYWGYVTSGGSESNLCGIDLAFARNKNAILYFCEAAHYSIVKHSKHYHSQVLPCRSNSEQINAAKLVETAILNYESLGKSANIVLTHGTTKYGACDDIEYVTSQLTEHCVPFCLHVDAALYGGLPENQIDAPIIHSLAESHINSISLSFHKFIGYPRVKSLILATEPPTGRHISYIGQRDTSTSGSRDILPFSLYEHTRELLFFSKPDEYIKNVRLFEQMIIKSGVSYTRADKSNIFVIDAPRQEIAESFQLSCFTDKSGNKKAHIIIFPYHTQENMQALIDGISAK